MKLFVQARKDGYNVLYPKPTPSEFFQFAGDIKSINNVAGNFLGKCIYSIAFASGGTIFTKHILIHDVQREGLGNVGFSVFIPNNKKLSGIDAKTLLDELLTTYYINYCPDFYLTNKQEDWPLFEAIVNQYDNRLQNRWADDVENCSQGTGDPAYIYYSDATELCKYFDDPCQQPYKAYKQVFLVEKSLDGKPDNPLHTIRHNVNANLTGHIDLDNKSYTLTEFYGQGKDGLIIEAWAANNAKLNNNNKIRKREIIKLRYSKNNYFKPIEVIGSITEESISQYISIVGESKLKIKNDVELEKVKKEVFFDLKDGIGNNISDVEIICSKEYTTEEKRITGTLVRFEGEELKYKWSVLAKKGDLVSKPVTIIPENQTGILRLDLIKQKVLRINAIDSEKNTRITNLTIRVNDGNGLRNNVSELFFKNDEIDKTWQIEINHNDYETVNFKYCPATDGDIKEVQLNRKKFKSTRDWQNKKGHYLKIDENKGKRLSVKGSSIPDFVNDTPVVKIKSKFGFKFNKWEGPINQPYSGYEGYYEAIFKELWFHRVPKFIWVVVILAAIAGIVIIFTAGPKPSNNEEMVNKIITYTNGIELNKDTLELYKSQYCNPQKTPKNNSNEKSGWQRFWPFGTNSNKNQSSENQALCNCCADLDTALIIRNAIISGDIDVLKKIKYSNEQKKFEKAILGIDAKYKKLIRDTLKANKKVSTMNLDEVAELINNTLKNIKDQDNETPTNNEEVGTITTQVPPTTAISTPGIDNKEQKMKKNAIDFWNLVRNRCKTKKKYDDLFRESNRPFYDKYYNFYLNYMKTETLFNKNFVYKDEIIWEKMVKDTTIEDLIKHINE